MISDKTIQEFKQIMKEEYGVELSDEESREQGETLVKYFDLLIQVDQRNKQKENFEVID